MQVRVIPRGVRLTFGGYSDKLQNFASYVSKKISVDAKDVLPNNEAEFERYKDIISRTYAAFDVKQPYAHCASFSVLTMTPSNFEYSNQDMREATDAVSLEDLKSYVNSLWSSGKGLALVQGNLFEAEALNLVSTLDKALRFKSIELDEYPPPLSPLPLPSIAARSKPTRLMVSERKFLIRNRHTVRCYVDIQPRTSTLGVQVCAIHPTNPVLCLHLISQPTLRTLTAPHTWSFKT